MPEEPWLRGPLPDVSIFVAPTIHALLQVQEDLGRYTEGLSDAEVWFSPYGLAPLGFHLRHMAGSLDRLTTYLSARELNDAQFQFLRTEMEPGAAREELLADLYLEIEKTSRALSALDVARVNEARTVGRKRLPTTVMGLIVHIAEHTQRHLGECIVICQLLRRS